MKGKEDRDVLTRREVINEWNLDKRYHNRFCCPHCRDLLVLRAKGLLFCENLHCENNHYYGVDGVQIK